MSSNPEEAISAATETQAGPAVPSRYIFIDVWRGLAIIGVVIYHFGWDLTFFGFIPSSFMFSGPVTLFARALAGSFMFLAGVSLVLAHCRRTRWRKFLKRLAKLVAAAAAISGITYFLFPEEFIYFGILHAIALASLLGLAFLRLPTSLVFLASLVVLAAPFLLETSAFDPRAIAWIGFAADPPIANDFVPVFPWFGVTLAGIAFAQFFVAKQGMRNAMPQTTGRFSIKSLTWAGQRTLPIYLLHQPLLFVGFVMFTRLSRS